LRTTDPSAKEQERFSRCNFFLYLILKKGKKQQVCKNKGQFNNTNNNNNNINRKQQKKTKEKMTKTKEKKEDTAASGDDDDSPEKGGLGTRMKKNLAGKVMASSLGKKIIPQQARGLLKGLNNIVTKVYGAKRATEIEKSIIKLIVKAKICIDDKKVTEDDFLQADAPLRKAFNVIVDLYDFYGDPVNDRMKASFTTAANHLKEVGNIISALMKPHVQPKNLQRLKDVFDVLGNVDFFIATWQNPDTGKEMEDLVDAMNKYTQFNF